jgi:hypothetical protein
MLLLRPLVLSFRYALIIPFAVYGFWRLTDRKPHGKQCWKACVLHGVGVSLVRDDAVAGGAAGGLGIKIGVSVHAA